MITTFLVKTTRLAILALGLLLAMSLQADARTTTQTAAAEKGRPHTVNAAAFHDSAEAGMLREAYHTLATADHDYSGHRIKAMHAVEAAGKLLGLNMKGDLKDREPQAISDAKLRAAKSQLSSVLNAAEVKDQKPIVKHLAKAISELNTALALK